MNKTTVKTPVMGVESRSKKLPGNASGVLPWVLYAALIMMTPIAFSAGQSTVLLCQMGGAVVFALSFNMLLGQGGMLSFGHAVYSGFGAFVVAHAMNAAARGSLWMPVEFAPLVGGLAGLLSSAVLGFVTTRNAGTAFAMITFGIGELVYVAASMFPGFFGGETGVPTNRVYGKPLLGIVYGSSLQTYYLIGAWMFACTVAMYAFTCTPLGRIVNAVRDNPERVAFIGFNARRARYFTLILAGFFAGIAGGLSTVNFETVTTENLSAAQSGSVLLFTFIGGSAYFAGPIVGAVVGTLLTVSLAAVTKAWLFYLGVAFLLIVKFAPGGLCGMAESLWTVTRAAKLPMVAAPLAATVASATIGLTGCVLTTELLYRRSLVDPDSATPQVLGFAIDATSVASWIAAVTLIVVGAVLFHASRKWLRPKWDAATAHATIHAKRVTT